MEELDEVRRTGVAYDREEHTEGICALGTLVKDRLGNMLAISVPMPTSRFRENQPTVGRALLQCRRQIEEMLDARPKGTSSAT